MNARLFPLFCKIHPKVALHPAGGGFCHRCAAEMKETA